MNKLEMEVLKAQIHMNSATRGIKVVQSAINKALGEYWQVDGIMSKKWKQRFNDLCEVKQQLVVEECVDIKMEKIQSLLKRKPLEKVITKYLEV